MVNCVARARNVGRWRDHRTKRAGSKNGEPIAWHSARVLSDSNSAQLRRDIQRRGFAILDDVISKVDAQATKIEFKTLFERYGIVKDSDTHEAGIRSDYVQGVNEFEARFAGFPWIGNAIQMLKCIGHELATLLPDGGESLAAAPCAQLAIYPGQGSRYGRHGDNLYAPSQPENAPSGYSNWRVWTVILYLNKGWVPADGGCLRIYGSCRGAEAPLPAATLRETDEYVDVEPLPGRVVAFNSLLHHEVMPVDGLRVAITEWFWRTDGNLGKAGLS